MHIKNLYMPTFIALTAESCACSMVSKLKVRPFHKVNSPDDAPVISLRPSGVHASVNIGHRIFDCV